MGKLMRKIFLLFKPMPKYVCSTHDRYFYDFFDARFHEFLSEKTCNLRIINRTNQSLD